MSKAQLEESQIVLCTVTKIIGTTVFVNLDEYHLDGTLSFPEVAPGRIRNIRDYAFPGKKIVCKVLKIHYQSVEVSLRRVKVSERNEFNERHKKEKNYSAMLRTVLTEKSEEVIAKIRSAETSLYDFIESARENPSILDKYMPKEQAQRIASIIKEKKAKETIVSQKFLLSSKNSNGIKTIKEIVNEASREISEASLEISYLAAGRYLIKLKSKDPKYADQQIRKILDNMESLAKKKGAIFELDKT